MLNSTTDGHRPDSYRVTQSSQRLSNQVGQSVKSDSYRISINEFFQTALTFEKKNTNRVRYFNAAANERIGMMCTTT